MLFELRRPCGCRVAFVDEALRVDFDGLPRFDCERHVALSHLGHFVGALCLRLRRHHARKGLVAFAFRILCALHRFLALGDGDRLSVVGCDQAVCRLAAEPLRDLEPLLHRAHVLLRDVGTRLRRLQAVGGALEFLRELLPVAAQPEVEVAVRRELAHGPEECGEARAERALPELGVRRPRRGEHLVAPPLPGVALLAAELAHNLRHAVLEPHAVHVQRAVEAERVVRGRAGRPERARPEEAERTRQVRVRRAAVPELGRDPEPLVGDLDAQRDVVVGIAHAAPAAARGWGGGRRRRAGAVQCGLRVGAFALRGEPLRGPPFRAPVFLPALAHVLGVVHGEVVHGAFPRGRPHHGFGRGRRPGERGRGRGRGERRGPVVGRRRRPAPRALVALERLLAPPLLLPARALPFVRNARVELRGHRRRARGREALVRRRRDLPRVQAPGALLRARRGPPAERPAQPARRRRG